MMAPLRLTTALDAAVYVELMGIAERQGAAEAGAVGEAVVAGIAAALREIAGPEAAYNTLQRWADRVADGVLLSIEGR